MSAPPPERDAPGQPLRCAAALIVDDDGRIFFQRRSPYRRLFPDTWDIVGGHVEPGETLLETLYREVQEETGWQVARVLAEVGEYRYVGDDGIARVEVDYLVRVDGDLAHPVLEPGKHTEFRWLRADELDVLDESAEVNDGLIRRIADNGFTVLRALGL